MKFTSDFNAFMRSTVNLDDSRLEHLESRVEAIEDYLATSGTWKETFLDVIPTGSWAHRTIIQPVRDNDEFDADILLYVTENPDWSPRDYVENLYQSFRASTTYSDKVSRMTRCVRVDYKGDMHVDVVPYLERSGVHAITNRHEPEGLGRFEASNPEQFAEWVDERQRHTAGQFIKVVRLTKYLRDAKDTFSCKSIILTTLLGEVIRDSESYLAKTIYPELPTAFKVILRRLADSLPLTMPVVLDPGGTGEDLAARYKETWDYANFRTQIQRYADWVDEAYDCDDSAESTRLWRKVLGEEFRSATSATASATVAKSAPSSVEHPGEQFIDREPYSFPIALVPGAALKITARCTGLRAGTYFRKNGFRQFNLSSNGNRVRKNRSIRFAARTSLTEVTLYWKVRGRVPASV